MQEIKVDIDEYVRAEIWKNNMLQDIQWIRGNTVTQNGKNELCQLVAGADSKTIDTIWSKINGVMTSKTSTNSRSNNTLSVAHSSPYTTAGAYTAIYTGNSSLGTLSYYNSIAINIDLTSGSELLFTMYWVFSGEGTGYFGSEICASRLGKINDNYNNPISSIATFLVGVQQYCEASSNTVSGNTLSISHSTPFTSGSFDGIAILTNDTGAGRFFDKYSGFTVVPDGVSEMYVNVKISFG